LDKKRVTSIKAALFEEYKDKYFRRDQGIVDDQTKPGSSDDTQKIFVTNQAYKSFYRHHKIASPADNMKPAKVNWFEALAYAACLGGKLPRRDEVRGYDESEIAVQYLNMLSEHRKQPSWRRRFLLDSLLGDDGKFLIYLPGIAQD